mgnify:FL=1|tara:strand:+ start:1908 stop:2342 length:435 start_codon:yes stop_codon:yes gene_type:complete
MKYAIIDGTTITKTGTIYELFPNTSFPKSGPPASFVSENNLLEITEWLATSEPDQKLTYVDVYLDSGKAYSVKVETCTDEEKAANIANQWIGIRKERNKKLKDTDWRASSDLTLSDDWKTYRQSLRDVPTQSDPWNITWPTEPS